MSAFRLVAPAGAPLPKRTILASLFAGSRPGRDVTDVWGTRLGVRHLFGVSSGRAALVVVLRALAQGSQRREVIVPAYTCFSVPSAVARAGLTIRLCDVDPKTLDLDLNALVRLDLDKVLCIVPSGLYGLPGDLNGMEGIARTSGTSLVDDAAQCLGATKDGKPCGTFGDAGFYSMGRGKNLTTMGGGILVTHRSELAQRIEGELRDVRHPSTAEVGAAVGGSLVYGALLRPSRYWLMDRLLDLGGSRFDPEFPIARLSRYQGRLAARLEPLLDSYNEIRRSHADQLRCGIEDVEGIEIPRPIAGARPVYLRFPILTRDGAHRSVLLRRLKASGIGASASYPTGVGEIEGISRYLAPHQATCPGAQSIATRILTLPTHAWVTSRDIERMIAIVRES